MSDFVIHSLGHGSLLAFRGRYLSAASGAKRSAPGPLYFVFDQRSNCRMPSVRFSFDLTPLRVCGVEDIRYSWCRGTHGRGLHCRGGTAALPEDAQRPTSTPGAPSPALRCNRLGDVGGWRYSVSHADCRPLWAQTKPVWRRSIAAAAWATRTVVCFKR